MAMKKSSPQSALPQSAPAAAAAVAAGAIGFDPSDFYHVDSDAVDWKRHSLPSLPSDDNTLESSLGGGTEEQSGYIVRKSGGGSRARRKARHNRSAIESAAADEEEEEETERTHDSGEELDRFSGYSEDREPYRPQHQRRRHPAQHQGRHLPNVSTILLRLFLLQFFPKPIRMHQIHRNEKELLKEFTILLQFFPAGCLP
jgi:hypothetical protein